MEKRGVNNIALEGLKDLKPGEGVSFGDTTYEYGADLNTPGTPLIDPGTGKTVAIRVFQYKMNPEKRNRFPADRQSIFNSHSKEISRILWGDGLRPFDGAAPRVIVDRKKGMYQIFVPCESRSGVVFIDKPENLSTALAKGRSTPNKS